MGRWVDLAEAAINSIQVGTLSDDLWRVYVEILMVGYMRPDDDLTPRDLAWMLHRELQDLEALLRELGKRNLFPLDRLADWRAEREANARWRALRVQVLIRDDHACRYCDEPATHVDHIIPRCQGGTDDFDNLAAACQHCNLSKGGRTPEQAGMDLRDA